MSTNKQSRGWLLTLPADEYDAATVRAGLASWPYVGQQETGEETGYRHWQVYVESPGAIRFSTLRRAFSKGHFEQRKGTKQQAYDYCTKAETAVEGSRIESTPKIVLEESGRGARTDLTALHAMIADDGMSVDQVLLAVPSAARFVTSLRAIEQARDRAAATSLRDVKVEYWHGPTGVGKTRALWERYGTDAYTVSDYRHPFDGYAGQSVLVLDEYRGQLPISQLLQLLDVYPVELPARYANKMAAYQRVYIVSNEPLDLAALYPKAKRTTIDALRRRIHEVRDFGADPDAGGRSKNRGRHRSAHSRVRKPSAHSRVRTASGGLRPLFPRLLDEVARLEDAPPAAGGGG